MATNYVEKGETLRHANSSGSTLASGSAVAVGTVVGVAIADIKDGESGAVKTSGVFELTKVTADAPAQGAKVYFKSDGTITTTASGNTLAGVAWEAAANGDTTVDVLLNNMPG